MAIGTGRDVFEWEPMPWEPVRASATAASLTVEVTATPLEVEWDTGPLNGFYGYPELQYWTCSGPGDLFFEPEPEWSECKSWFMKSSAGQTDLIGTPDRISVTATVFWQISFTSNVGYDNPDWFIHDTTSQRHEIPVVEAQSIIIN